MDESAKLNTFTIEQVITMDYEEFLQFLNEPTVSEKDFDHLEELILNKGLSREKGLLVLDKLGFISTPSSTLQFITLYKHKSTKHDSEAQHLLLRNTQILYQSHNNFTDSPQEKQLLQEFYLELLDSNLNTRDAHIVLRGITTLSPEGMVLAHLSKIERLLSHMEETEIMLSLKTLLAFKSKSLEEVYIPEIIQTLEKENNLTWDLWFAGTISSFITTHGLNSLQAPSKHLISKRLTIIKSKLDARVQQYKYPQSAGIWLETTALTHSRTFNEAVSYLVLFLKNLSTEEQKRYVIGFTHSAYLKKAFKHNSALRALATTYQKHKTSEAFSDA